MIPCLLIKKVTRLATSSPQKTLEVAADVGPSGIGASKGSPMASSSLGWTTEGSASEGGPAVRVDSAKDFPMEPEGTDAVVEEFQIETTAKAVEAIPPLGNILIFRE